MAAGCIFYLAFGQKAAALKECDLQAIYGTWTHYVSTDCDKDAPASCSTNLAGGENAEKIWNFLIGKGLSPIQAAGVMGNFQAESGFDPTIVEGGGHSNTIKVDGLTGYGIAQWTSMGRQQAILDFATQGGKPDTNVSDLAVQLDYTYLESTVGLARGSWAKQLLATDVPGATVAWHNNYEISDDGPDKIQNRIDFAEKIFLRFGSSTPSGPTTPSSPGSSSPNSSCAGGGSGQINGDPYTDSTDVPCAPGTDDRGVADGYKDGTVFKVRLCSLPNMPSTGSADNGFAVVNSRVSGAWFNLVNDAKAAGIALSATSSFRSMASQESLFAANPDPEYVARPGYSSHQAGVAIDLAGMNTKGGQDCAGGRAREPGNAMWQWMVDNAGKYGFKQYSAESWHWDAYPSANRCGAG